MNVVRRFARIRGEVVKVTLPSPVPPVGQARAPGHAAQGDEAELRRALAQAVSGLTAGERAAFVQGVALALELGAERLIDLLGEMPASKTKSGGQPGRIGTMTVEVDLVDPGDAPRKANPPGHPAHRPAGDPHQEWRRPGRWLNAPGFDLPDDAASLSQHDTSDLWDIWFAWCEWGRMASDPQVRAMADRAIAAGESILRGDIDDNGRSPPLGRLMGLQPPGPGGLSARQSVQLKRRNALLRQARACRPEWRDAPDRTAAALMLAEFQRYRDGAWLEERQRDTAAAGNPARAYFWRVLRLGASVPSTAEGLSLILMREG